MDAVVIGSGPTGLLVGATLAQRGHRVLSVDRDPGPAADGHWPRRGVMQFEHAHGFRPQVDEVLARWWEPALDAWRSAGAESMTATVPGQGETSLGFRSRRSTLERALRSTAATTPGLRLRCGHVDSLVVAEGRVTGVVVDGRDVAADLVVDASGRSGRIGRSPGEPGLDGSCGMAYVDRTYRLKPGADPGPMDSPVVGISEYDGYQVLVFLHEAGHFSVLFVRPTADEALKQLRHTAAFEAACRAVPPLAEWTDPGRSSPTGPVLVGGALRNTYRPQRRVPGLVAVGDAVATTTPTRGRGLAMAFTQVDALLTMLDGGADPLTVAEPLEAWSEEAVRPWVDDHIAIDTEAVARWRGADVDLTGPLTSHSVCLAGQVDPRIHAYAAGYYAMTSPPSSLAPAEPLARSVYGGGWRAPYAPGPSRDELVEVIERAVA